MKKILITILTILSISFSSNTYSQNLEDILNNHFQAIGQDALLKQDTYSLQAIIKQMGMEIPIKLKIKRPNKFRIEMEIQGQTLIQVYNGQKGWMLTPWINSEPQELKGTDLDKAMEQSNIDGELYNYKAKGYTATLIGKVNIDNIPMYNIKLTTEDGTVKNFFIDTDQYLIRKVKVKLNEQGQNIEVEQNMSDYKKIDGILMSTNIESKSPMGVVEILFNDIKFGEKMSESIFEKP